MMRIPTRLILICTILAMGLLFAACSTATPTPTPTTVIVPTVTNTEVLATVESTLEATENPLSGGFATPVGTAASEGNIQRFTF